MDIRQNLKRVSFYYHLKNHISRCHSQFPTCLTLASKLRLQFQTNDAYFPVYFIIALLPFPPRAQEKPESSQISSDGTPNICMFSRAEREVSSSRALLSSNPGSPPEREALLSWTVARRKPGRSRDNNWRRARRERGTDVEASSINWSLRIWRFKIKQGWMIVFFQSSKHASKRLYKQNIKILIILPSVKWFLDFKLATQSKFTRCTILLWRINFLPDCNFFGKLDLTDQNVSFQTWWK